MVNLILVNILKLHGTYIKFQPQQLQSYSAQIQLSVCKSLHITKCTLWNGALSSGREKVWMIVFCVLNCVISIGVGTTLCAWTGKAGVTTSTTV
jgi:hypothetical protein